MLELTSHVPLHFFLMWKLENLTFEITYVPLSVLLFQSDSA